MYKLYLKLRHKSFTLTLSFMNSYDIGWSRMTASLAKLSYDRPSRYPKVCLHLSRLFDLGARTSYRTFRVSC